MSQVKVILLGGPPHLPADRRIQRVVAVEETLKLPLGAGYEHFRHEGENASVDGEDLPVLRWVMHTAIAE
ncbi:DUF5988 family protein [Nonomuraea sp. NPDC050790]|uniref:DUF5988 family protein n=1 Tax=Nonomuraea sp. NPDC050790 TaxID=3364371 RepID=UPI0037A29375